MTTLTIRRVARLSAALMLTAVVLLSSASIASAAVAMHGTFTTPARTGTITYKPLRAFRGGSEGTFSLAGKRYPGSLYAATNGGIGMALYYGTSGLTAANALVTPQPSGAYTGPIWFFDRSGTQTEAGTVSVTFP